ncbi:uncharacterized protein DS421_7g210430 [Arachis hypogaea]|nr:uncharacterized protein DS421_7g210430 [Arachis hypogaea]
MDKGKGVMGSNARRWAVDFSDNSTSPSSRDVPDPPAFSRASIDQDDSTLSRQKKDAESNWKAQCTCSALLSPSQLFGSLSAPCKALARLHRDAKNCGKNRCNADVESIATVMLHLQLWSSAAI